MNRYVGRFAPSPTGPLHAGSVLAALGSHLEARRAGGRWLLRIDDIDPPREMPGAADRILRQLEALGLEWDGPVVYQSDRTEAYEAGLERLRQDERVYCCSCSRRDLAGKVRHGPLGAVYPGHCRHRHQRDVPDTAVRLRLPPGRLRLRDRIQGEHALDGTTGIGDPVVRRRDGLWAYHLANAVDDAALGVTEIVRGADLLSSALVQVALQQALSLPAPAWCHLPTLVGADSAKLSKQTGALPVDETRPLPALLAAWVHLGQRPLPESPADVAEFHALARAHWRPDAIPRGPVCYDP